VSADCELFITEDRTVVVVGRKARSKWWSVCCIGRKRHYRKDGSCKHAHAVLEALQPDIKSRAKIEPFGGKARRAA
jgi:hypothetical protein